MYSWSLPEEVGNRRFCIFSRDNFEIGESAPTTSMAASPTAAMGWCGIACSVRAPPVRARDRGGQGLGRGPDGIAGSHDAARAQADDLAEGAVVEDAGQHDGHARPSGQVTADRLGLYAVGAADHDRACPKERPHAVGVIDHAWSGGW